MTPDSTPRDVYASPFVTRWASHPMQKNWSDLTKYRCYRRLWVALAQAQSELGLDISEEQVEEMRAHLDEIDFDAVARIEQETRHEVMTHVRVFGEQCPKARPIIHLGATSVFVDDNTYLIQVREGLRLLVGPLATACRQLADFAAENADQPCLAYTHFQPGQPTTVGKRACLWLQDLLGALERIADLAEEVPFRGVKGTTGTQASYLALFEGDGDKVEELERRVAAQMGFKHVVPVTGQTSPRVIDYRVLTTLGELAIACSKMANDIRLLAGLKEMEEPFGRSQIGSSAMAYKRNPMRSERMTSLSRFILNQIQNAAFTAADQWLERTLDDSAVRRLYLSESFLAADSIATLAANVTAGLVVNGAVVERRLSAELSFMATENILMQAVKAGGDRQELHELIRRHSMAAAHRVKNGDGENDLLDRIRRDPAFGSVADRLEEIAHAQGFVGRAPDQVRDYLAKHVGPALARFPEGDASGAALRV